MYYKIPIINFVKWLVDKEGKFVHLRFNNYYFNQLK